MVTHSTATTQLIAIYIEQGRQIKDMQKYTSKDGVLHDKMKHMPQSADSDEVCKIF